MSNKLYLKICSFVMSFVVVFLPSTGSFCEANVSAAAVKQVSGKGVKSTSDKDTNKSAFKKVLMKIAVPFLVVAGAVAGAAAYFWHSGSSSNSKSRLPSKTQALPGDDERDSIYVTHSAYLPCDPGGLYNVGLSCYYNAMLQFLYDVEDFRSRVLTSNLACCAEPVKSKIETLRIIFMAIYENKVISYNEMEKYMEILGHKKRVTEDPVCVVAPECSLLGDVVKSLMWETGFIDYKINAAKSKIGPCDLYVYNQYINKNQIIFHINRLSETERGRYYDTFVPALKNKEFKGANYRLTNAVVYRPGNGGHYVSYYFNDDDTCICYNDREVTRCNSYTVKKEVEENCTMLLYTRV